MNLQECVEIINDAVNDSISEFRQLAAVEVADAILYGDRYEHHLPSDAIFDYSGELRKKEGGFNLSNYSTVGDFLEEYTGEREASFCSGYGWNYTRYENNLERMAMEFIGDVAQKTCNKIVEENKDFVIEIIGCNDLDNLGDELLTYIYEDHDCYDNMIQGYEVLENITELPLEILYNEGEFQAKRNKQEANKKAKQRAEKISVYKDRATILYARLAELYKKAYNKDIKELRQMDKSIFNSIIGFLKENFSDEEIAILGRFMFICSNSVEIEFKKMYKLDI